MGRNEKERGATYERELVRLQESLGYTAEKVYGSGAIGTRQQRQFSGLQELGDDVVVTSEKLEGVLPHAQLRVESKYRRKEFAKWLQQLDTPIRSLDGLFSFIPGYDTVEAFLTPPHVLEVRNVPTSKYAGLLGESHMLACRFPKNKYNPSGWVMVVPVLDRGGYEPQEDW